MGRRRYPRAPAQPKPERSLAPGAAALRWVPLLLAVLREAGFVRHLLEAAADLRRLEPTVPAEGPDGRQLPGARPAGHRLGVDTEQRRHLAGGEQGLGCVEVVVLRHGV